MISEIKYKNYNKIMQFTLTDLQTEIKENSNKLLKENIDLLETIQKVDDNCRLDEKVWQLVIDQGWLALDVPEEDGGLGFSNTDTAILSEVLGYYMPIIPIFSSGVVFKHILLNSKKEKKDELLTEIISGQKIGTFAVYENDKYEINENTISTQLTTTDSGFKLNGLKKYVMFGDVSNYIAVLAKSEDSFKFVLVDADAEGVEVKQTTSLDQTRPMCEVKMEDVQLEQDSVLIDLDSELSEWNKVKNIALGYLAMEQVGASQACLDMSTKYAKERIQFGRPIGSFQAIQHICANMLMQLESAKSVAYSAVRVDYLDDVETEMSSMLAKSYCSEVFNKIAGDNIQVHGGIGFTWEHPAHLYFKKAKSDSLLLGTPKLARDKIAELLSL
jgi:alkylation response protein AidB-like acyl-CoA dehydrogenase|tara:strand:- start:559 stop:1719 length:1161 start_codon:yes stop_codon:yes gene_type:complete